MSLKLDSLNEKDIPALLRLAQEIGWGYNQKNWLQFMKLGQVVGHRLPDGSPISSAVMIRYGDSLRWLTSFIVSPRFQRQGLASALWSSFAQEFSQGALPVGLISTEEGVPFYEAMGFQFAGQVYKFVRPNGLNLNIPKISKIQTATVQDLNEMILLDKACSGVDRSVMLQGKYEVATKSLKTIDPFGKLNGCAISSLEGELLCVGPIIAPDESTAAELILKAIEDYEGPVRMDLFEGQSDLFAELLKKEFVLERIAPILSFQGRKLPLRREEYRGLAAQALA